MKAFALMQYLIPQHVITFLAGKIANCTWPLFKNRFIHWFIKRYQVDLTSAVIQNPKDFACFNDFFTRALLPNARPLDPLPGGVICPVDGVISQLGNIQQGRIFQAKQHFFAVEDLLGGDSFDPLFLTGNFVTFYLSPKDYHRIHMPFEGELQEMRYVPGNLFSVNQTTTESIPTLFARNERVICFFKTAMGPMAVVLVGAMIVGSIETVFAGTIQKKRKNKVYAWRYGLHDHPLIRLLKGAELGRFKLGSTVIVLFPENKVSFEKQFQAGSFVQWGQLLGKIFHAESLA